MGRARLMEQQRKRRDVLKATKKATKAAADKIAADNKRYGSGGKPAVTRDTSKDKPKRDYTSGGKPAVTRDTSKDKPKTPAKPKPKAKPPAPKAKPKGAKPSTDHPIMSSSSTYTGDRLNKPKPKGKPPATDSNIMSSSSTYTGNNLTRRPSRTSRYSGGRRASVKVQATAPNRNERRRRGS